MNDIFDEVLEATGGPADTTRRPCPGGKFLATVANVTKSVSGKGTQGLELELNLNQPLGEQDMTGVDLSRVKVWDTVWITERSRNFARDRALDIIVPENKGKPLALREFPEQAIGRPVIVNLVPKTEDSNGKPFKYPRLEVTAYEAAV